MLYVCYIRMYNITISRCSYYPLEQRSCRRDIGSCPYVCTYVRMILSCHRSSEFISRTILTKLHTSVQYGKTSNEFVFHDAASKVKVTVTIFRKCLSSLYRLYFSNEFDETSHKYSVWQDFKRVRVS
jgi:hypothetical protein